MKLSKFLKKLFKKSYSGKAYKRREKFQKIKAKVFRYLHLTKPMILDDYDLIWIRFCKGKYDKTFDYRTKHITWIDPLKPLYQEIYGIDPNEYPREFRECMFSKLLDVYFRIKLDESGHDHQIKKLMHASFTKGISRDQELPIERTIAELCGLIQCTAVIKDGVHRFDWELKDEYTIAIDKKFKETIWCLEPREELNEDLS